MANKKATQSSDKITKRLNRIRGQMDGVIKMYDSGRDCIELVTQIAAARSALGAVARDLLFGEASRCATNKDNEQLMKVLKASLK